jgi:plastocyanin
VTVTVAAGTTVTFVNEDDVPHTATSGAGEPDGTFDLDLPGAGGSATFTFDEPGSYDYYCRVHPSMTAVVEVA